MCDSLFLLHIIIIIIIDIIIIIIGIIIIIINIINIIIIIISSRRADQVLYRKQALTTEKKTNAGNKVNESGA